MSDAQTAQARELSVGKGAALVCALALLMTALMAAPVILWPTERIFGSGRILSPEDPNRDALVVIDQFRTGRVPPPYLQPLTDLPGQVLARFIGPVPAYSLLVLLTFPLAALTAYLLARYALASHFAAMVAGLSYAFLPFHVLQAGGHPHIAQTQWLPLYLLALWACIDRPTAPRGLLMLLAGTAVGLADFYAGFIIAVLSPVALLSYGIGGARPSTKSRGRRMAVVAALLIAAGTLGLGAIRIFVPTLTMQREALAFPRAELFEWSARWWSYLVPPADHPIWGASVVEFWSRHGIGPTLLEHQQVSLGISLVLLALVPLWIWLRGSRDTPATRMAPVLTALAVAALLCSLSPERTIAGVTFIRPSAFLYEIAPMFRAYARFGVVVGLMASLLAGAGASMLWQRGRWGKATAALLLGLAVVEGAPFPPWRSRDVLPTAAHRFLRSQPGAMRVLDCVDPSRGSDTLISSLLGHDISTLGASGFDDCGEPRLGEKLRALGYSHLIIRGDTKLGAWFAEDPSRFSSQRFLTPVIGFQKASILSASGEPPPAYLKAWLGFYPREYEGGHDWRWMAGVGTLRFAVARELTGTTLALELRSFPLTRRIEWLVDGRRLGELQVTTEWRRYELPLGPLRPGEIAVTLSCLEPAVSAKDVLLNQDPRALGLAVGGFDLHDSGH